MTRFDPIAIVGLGGIFPGGSDLDDFWSLVRDGRSAAQEVPEHRWVLPPKIAASDSIGEADRVNSTRGCFLEATPPIDPRLRQRLLAAGVDPDGLDPLIAITLEVGRRAFESGRLDRFAPDRVGAVFGNIVLPTESASALSREVFDTIVRDLDPSFPLAEEPAADPRNRYAAGLPGGLLATALGFTGATSTLDAACASSLYALHLAARELHAGRLDAVLAGGVSRPDCQYTQMGFSQLRAVSPDGICRPFDERGNGLVVGEGGGLFALRRLEDAVRDSDTIWGVIRGIGLSNDLGGSLLAPDTEGQLRALREAYARADWQPQDVDLIECHATGTPLGDAIEATSLKELWTSASETDSPAQERCVIGSVKSNVGHLLTGAGAAGLTKILLAFRHETLPPTAGFARASAKLELDPSPFRVLEQSERFVPRNANTPRRAALSAFGFGGINAHVLIEEWAATPDVRATVVDDTASNSEAKRTDERSTEADPTEEPIAIVGLGACLPNVSRSELPDVLLGRGARTRGTPLGWWGRETKRHEFDGIDGHWFDELSIPVGRYRIPPNEFGAVLPQQWTALEAASDAFDEANWSDEDGRRTGAFVGIALDPCTTDFTIRWGLEARTRVWASDHGFAPDDAGVLEWIERLKAKVGPPLTSERTLGALGGIVASRIARELRLGGPSFTISSEETSSLRALEHAVHTLRAGDIDRAIVGGVELGGDLRALLGQQAMAPIENRVVGEGAFAVAIMRRSDAIESGRPIYATIRSIASASGSPDAAQLASARAKSTAACAHSQEFTQNVQTRIGECGAAAGLGAIVSSALALATQLRHADQGWVHNRADGPRIAEVAQSSVDGSATHVVLEEADPDPAVEFSWRRTSRRPALFAIEAETDVDVDSALDDLHSRITAEVDVRELARRWLAERPLNSQHAHAVALVAESSDELSTAIAAARRHLAGEQLSPADNHRVFVQSAPLGPAGQLAFVYPGSGSHYLGMGRELAAAWTSVVEQQHRENDRLLDQWQCDRYWADDADPSTLDDAVAAIFAQVATGALVTDVLRDCGVKPSAAIGYSLGETASLFSNRVWRDRDGMLERMLASPLFAKELSGPCDAARRAWDLPAGEPVDWRVGVVDRSAATVREQLKADSRAYVLIANTPDETVIGGDRSAVETVVTELGATFVELRGVSTVHCDVVESVREQYLELHRHPVTVPEGLRLYSAFHGMAYDVTSQSAAASITDQAVSGFDFPALIENAYADGVRLFLEVGPGTSATRAIDAILGERPHCAFSVLRSGRSETRSLFEGLARLIVERIPVDLDRALPKTPSSDARATLPVARLHAPIDGDGLHPPEPKRVSTASRSAVAPPPTMPPMPAALQPTVPQPTVPQPTGQTLEAVAVAIDHLQATERATNQAHAAYLEFAAEGAELVERIALERSMASPSTSVSPATSDRHPPSQVIPTKAVRTAAGQPATFATTDRTDVIFDTDDCMKLAIGSLADVLGNEFAAVDQLPTRVRLPDDPLMLAHRIVELEGTPRSLGSGRVVTEHDIVPGAWYLDGNRIPVCIAVEAGQADLFLSGYLGIDFHTRGEGVYRLLDAEITFHDELPAPGSTIRYDIRIDHFFYQGDTALFRFFFDATVDGRPVLSMRNGCAGFFTQQELDAGQGIVQTRLDLTPRPGIRCADWRELAPFLGHSVESYDDSKIEALRSGDLAACFGERFAALGLKDPDTLPSGRMRLVDRILELAPEGGRFGLGRIRGELDIHPDDWFLTCHFSDDQVMPGTLMYECCLHTLRIFLMRMGWVGERGSITHQPIAGVRSRLKCRGQVTESTQRVQYEVTVKEVGYGPASRTGASDADTSGSTTNEPYVLADVLMYADGRAVVEMNDMSVRLEGMTREAIESVWLGTPAAAPASSTEEQPSSPYDQKPALYDNDRIVAFAVGNPSEAFGAPYQPFDHDRVIARLPGAPYKFLDRITAIHGGTPFVLAAGTQIEAQYDVPPEEWYFQLPGGRARMPFAVLLEVALQPCGWLAAYLGSALVNDVDLKFRNLGGSAVQLRPVTPDCGTLTTTVKLTAVSNSGGMIIQHYDLHVRDRAGTVYEGTTYFGFFTAEALATQIGIRDAGLYAPSVEETARATALDYPSHDPFPRDRLRMIDRVSHYDPAGGEHGLGFVRGSQVVDEDAWFFAAHFHQDPVCPGSLGLEAFLQLMQLRAMDAFDVDPTRGVLESMACGSKHEWIYRGQYIQKDHEVTVEATISSIDPETRTITADGFLSVDGRTIYQMVNFSAQWVETADGGESR